MGLGPGVWGLGVGAWGLGSGTPTGARRPVRRFCVARRGPAPQVSRLSARRSQFCGSVSAPAGRLLRRRSRPAFQQSKLKVLTVPKVPRVLKVQVPEVLKVPVPSRADSPAIRGTRRSGARGRRPKSLQAPAVRREAGAAPLLWGRFANRPCQQPVPPFARQRA